MVRRASFRENYALKNRLLDAALDDVAFFQAQHTAMLRRAIDAEQRNVLLKDQVAILREQNERLQHQLSRANCADEITSHELRIA